MSGWLHVLPLYQPNAINENIYGRWYAASWQMQPAMWKLTYPLRTPSTKLSIKKDPRMMRGIKYIQLKLLPSASFVCKEISKIVPHVPLLKCKVIWSSAVCSWAGIDGETKRENCREIERKGRFNGEKTYVVQNTGPAFHGDALEDGEHSVDNVVEAGDSVVRTLPVRAAVRSLWTRMSSRSLGDGQGTRRHLFLTIVIKFTCATKQHS